MKYVIPLVLVLAAWLIIDRLVLATSDPGAMGSFGEKMRALGRKIHLVFGIVAVLLLALVLLRLLFLTLGYW